MVTLLLDKYFVVFHYLFEAKQIQPGFYNSYNSKKMAKLPKTIIQL